jgi:hypothetical protein
VIHATATPAMFDRYGYVIGSTSGSAPIRPPSLSHFTAARAVMREGRHIASNLVVRQAPTDVTRAVGRTTVEEFRPG